MGVTGALGAAGAGHVGEDDGTQGVLGEFLHALGVLAPLQLRQQERLAKGEAFVEDSSTPAITRRFDRPLRAALGLASTQAAVAAVPRAPLQASPGPSPRAK